MSSEPKPKGFGQKVYLVVEEHGKAPSGDRLVKIAGVRLTRQAADALSDKIPGTVVDRMIATK